jgi:light-harvesting complex I chlorophyll a/b binding protein 3
MLSAVSGSKVVAVRASAPRAQRASRLVVRAEETGVAKVVRDKSKLGLMGAGGLGVTDRALTYLDGSLPGDFGFDPLGLSDPEGAGGAVAPNWLANAEIIHCRWAMLGAAGCIAPEIMHYGQPFFPEENSLAWFATGVIPPAGKGPEYWTDNYTLFAGEMTLMGFAELRRLQDFRKPGSMAKQDFLGLEQVFGGSGKPSYPGGQFFNMCNFGSKGDMDKLKLNEVKNGRLAMIAMLGYFVQAAFTHVGPYENLMAHLADPVHNNFLTTIGKVGGEF